jgi:hypothetical protein
LRVGYGIAHPELIEVLQKTRHRTGGGRGRIRGRRASTNHQTHHRRRPHLFAERIWRDGPEVYSERGQFCSGQSR